MSGPVRVGVEDASQVPLARQLAAETARESGLSGTAVDTVALVATELAQNLHLHATDGQLLVVPGGWGGQLMSQLLVIAVDRGPGVTGFDRCLVDGFSTRGTLGAGLGAVRRLTDSFDAVSELGVGTVVCAGFDRPLQSSSRFDVGAMGQPISGETVNGDGWGVRYRGGGLDLMLADGLGHGPLAASASGAAVRAFAARAFTSPADLLRQADLDVRRTRGAAATVVRISPEPAGPGHSAVSAGLGNVSLLVAGPDGQTKRVATSHGTLGSGAQSTAMELKNPVPAGGIVVLHSDGLGSRWDLVDRVELLRHSAPVIATALWRDHARGTDDSLVVVARAPVGEGEG